MKQELVSCRSISQDFELFRTRQIINSVCVDTGGESNGKFANALKTVPFNF